jgi:hypothetical protein
MSEKLELGQMLFGAPTGKYGTAEWVDALISELLSEIERVYWNKNQEQWRQYDDPKLHGVVFNPYYWGDDEKELEKPNLSFPGISAQEIRWYKHPGRGQSSTLSMEPEEWIEWFTKALEVIRSNDADII